MCYTCPAHLIHLDFITWTILGEEYRSLRSSLCSFPLPCYLVPPMPKYSPQHPILKHPQPTFLPQCEQPSFTSIQNKRQNYSSVYLNLYIFGQLTGRQTIVHQMIASIPWLQSALNFFFDMLRLFPNIWTLPPFQRNYYQSLYCYFVPHSYLETWPCT